MNVQPKIWNSNSTNTRIHVFLNGQARCGSNDKQNKSPMHTRTDGVVFAEDSAKLTFCTTCEKDFLAAEKRMAAKRAKMIAKTGTPVTPSSDWSVQGNVRTWVCLPTGPQQLRASRR